jgi:ParB family chromosome partitioning protein
MASKESANAKAKSNANDKVKNKVPTTKKPARKVLGRGINALLGGDLQHGSESSNENRTAAKAGAAPGTTTYSDSDYLELAIETVLPNATQPRTSFPEAELEELAQSIRVNGIVQPIIVREKRVTPLNKKVPPIDLEQKSKTFAKQNTRVYEIVAGERRWRAAQRAELKTIPAIVREIADNKMLEIALIENIQRQELNPVEESLAYRKLIDDLGLTQADVAERVGKTRTFVANYLRLLNLPNPILELIRDGRISVGHAKALLSIDNAKLQKELADRILAYGLSVREAEKAAKQPNRKPRSAAVPAKPDPNIKNAEVKLRRKYSTQVKIIPTHHSGTQIDTNKTGNGKIEFEYYGTEDLDRIFRLLMSAEEE